MPRKRKSQVENEEEEKETSPKVKSSRRTKSNSINSQESKQVEESSEDESAAVADKSSYFQSLHEESFKKSKIVKKTTQTDPASLPSLEISEMKRLIDETNSTLAGFLEPWQQKIKALWPQWKVQLETGFNLVFFGYGSKKMHLESFVKENFQHNHHVFVLNGYFPTGSVDSFISLVTRTLSETTSKHKKVLVLVHNIEGDSCFDGPFSPLFLMNELKKLAEFSFKFIFSIDHVNSTFALGMSYFSTSSCNFLMHELTTWQLYIEETSFENSYAMKTQARLGLRPLRHILQSVTANARSLFQLLAQMQLEAEGDDSQGISFQGLFQRGKDEFLFGSELVMRTLLGEFLDHKAIGIRKSGDSCELLFIPMDKQQITQILSEIEQWR